MKTWKRKKVLSTLLIVSMMVGLTQNPVWRVSAKEDIQDDLSVTAKLGSKKVNKKTVAVKKGSKKKINLSFTPKTSKVKAIYRSNKKSIASVTKAGVVKAKKQGTAKITITVAGKGKVKKKIWFKVRVVNKSNSSQKAEIPVTLTVDGKTFKAKFYNNQTARELVGKMPMTLSMKDLNGNEKYYYFNTDFSVNETLPKQINAGDIMMYGSDCLVAFYKTFTTSYRYTSIGYVEDASGFARAVGKGNVQVDITG